MDTHLARTRLEGLLAELDESASVVRSDGAETAVQDIGAEDTEDVATDLVDADREEASLEVIQAQRERVTDALARIDAGTYGICIDCGETIPDERLEARPEVARCIKDQAAFEAAR
ncbi:MAG TPA: TraR/DksA C4-type zinc finger protein [Mycobacteriales bacterium]|nr:TraR/DksA C4-type zinc finger protein [Mycobacteriales bacterium]